MPITDLGFGRLEVIRIAAAQLLVTAGGGTLALLLAGLAGFPLWRLVHPVILAARRKHVKPRTKTKKTKTKTKSQSHSGE
jgi:hypothetical protein